MATRPIYAALVDDADDDGRYPKKAGQQDIAAFWTRYRHSTITGLRRGGSGEWSDDEGDERVVDEDTGFRRGRRDAVAVDWALMRLMRNTQLRAPHRPRGCEKHQVLYRGMTFAEEPWKKVLAAGRFASPSFLAFSRDKSQVDRFGAGFSFQVGVVFVLDVADVHPGTPWVWFAWPCDSAEGAPTVRFKPRNKAAFAPTFNPHEQEVLLPPGELLFKRVLHVEDNKYEIQVAYRPVRADTLWKGGRGGRGFTFMPKTAFRRDGIVRAPRKDEPLPPRPLYALLESSSADRLFKSRDGKRTRQGLRSDAVELLANAAAKKAKNTALGRA